MTGASILLVVVGAVVAFGLGWRLTVGRNSPRNDWSLFRLALGAGSVMVAVLAGANLIDVSTTSPPQQRGIGVLVGPQVGGIPIRQHANPLTVTTVVDVTDCATDVQVRLTVTPTGSFWRRHHARLSDGAAVRIALPGTVVDNRVSASVGDDGLEAVVSPRLELSGSTAVAPVDVVLDDEAGVTLVTVPVDDWGTTNVPVSLRFAADWTTSRSMLGGCYLDLPALTGLQTALGGAELVGRALPVDLPLPGGTGNLFVVSSTTRHAYYNSQFEVTRGVTTLVLHDNTLADGGSGPAPDTNLGGNNAWTCRSTLTDSFGTVGATGAIPDLVTAPDDNHYSLSGQRLEEILAQQNCASFVAIQERGAGTKRDLVLIMVGALFSFGIELFLSGFRRRATG